MTTAVLPHRRISEAQLLDAVIEMAQTLGWKVAHFRPAQTRQGWRTAVQGDGKGFPDLVMVRNDEVIFAELKSERGRLTCEQHEWLVALATASALIYTWRPADYFSGQIEEILRGS